MVLFGKERAIMRTRAAGMLAGMSVVLASLSGSVARGYEHFKVSVYSRAYETREMNDVKWIEPRWSEISRQVHVDKIYLETHRDLIVVSEATLEAAKKFFADRGVQTAGGITLTVNERNRFETFCYTNPEHRRKVKEIVEYTARHFDEIILDDFFFTNCKCDLCIRAKGDKSWTEYRLELLAEAARDLIVGPAKAVNPKVKMVIKYPNWYEHFQGLGFNLEVEPALFDGIYTGTETRDPSGNQHLQQYLGYLIFRYFENLKPGGNGGGWVDTGGLTYLDRYAEQLWLTLFAKAPEITLFDLRQVQRPLPPSHNVAVAGSADQLRLRRDDEARGVGGWHDRDADDHRPGRRVHVRESGQVPGQTRPARRRQELQAVPFDRRGFPAQLPRHVRHPDGPRAAVPGRREDDPADGVRQVRPGHRREDQGPVAGRASRSSSLRVCCTPCRARGSKTLPSCAAPTARPS